MLNTTELLESYGWVLAVLALWDLAWKGLALWRAAQNNEKYWFVAILVLNTVGIFPIAYILYDKYRKNRQGKSDESNKLVQNTQ